MAKNWKSFVNKASPSTQNPDGSDELSGIEQELKVSVEDLAKSNDDLRSIMQERDALEQRMRLLVNPDSKKDEENPRFANAIISIDQKRKEDRRRFEIKQKLEAKIQQENKEVALWTKRRNQLNQKVNKVRKKFDQKKKQVTELKKKFKSKIADDFDYDKIGRDAKKLQDDFPFLERITLKNRDLSKKPIEKVKEKIKEKPVLKKIIDNWGIIKDRKPVSDFKGKSKVPDDFKNYGIIGDTIKQHGDLPFGEKKSKKKDEFFEKSKEQANEKIKKKPALKKIIDNWEKIKEKKGKAEKSKPEINRIIQKENELFESKEKIKKNKVVPKIETSEKLKGKKEEERRNEVEKEKEKRTLIERIRNRRKEERGQSSIKNKKSDGFSIDELEKEKQGEDLPERDSKEIALQKKKEQEKKEKEELERKEQLKKDKAKEKKIANKRESLREKRREERKKKSKDPYSY